MTSNSTVGITPVPPPIGTIAVSTGKSGVYSVLSGTILKVQDWVHPQLYLLHATAQTSLLYGHW